jgi:apolipoprotein D and lipocalin family protein
MKPGANVTSAKARSMLTKKARLLLGALAVVGCTTTTTARRQLPPLQTVAYVDLDRYLGTWYEIAAFPQRFQRGCTGSTATYTLRPDGEIGVVNRCRLGSLTGEEKVAKGRARVVDRATNAKLKVSFFRPFWGDYWIVDLGADYDYAVVGHPGRDYLWILGRNPAMDAAVYDGILARLRAQGYEVERLNRALQPDDR